VYVNVYPQGHVMTERDLVATVRDGLIETGRRIGHDPLER
jgi:hypothetical protein